MRDYKVYARSGSEGWLRDLLFLLLLFSVPFLASLGRLPLFGPYEGAYAEISRAMLERGDLITTSLDHLNRFGNPPLLFWLNVASLAFFGQNEFAVRFPTALCGLLTLPAVYVIARRLYDRRTALLSAILLGSCTGFALLSRGILTQLPLCLCLTAALGSFAVAAQGDVRQQGASGHWYPFYLFWALAVLAGGMVGTLLPAAVILVYLLLAGRWELLPRMRCGSGLLLFLVVAAPWFVAVWLESPESAHLLSGQGIGQYGASLGEDQRPFWLVVPLLVAGLLPWSGYVLPALSRAWREQGRGGGRSGLFLMVWALAILLFFVLSGSRPIPALLPAFPPPGHPDRPSGQGGAGAARPGAEAGHATAGSRYDAPGGGGSRLSPAAALRPQPCSAPARLGPCPGALGRACAPAFPGGLHAGGRAAASPGGCVPGCFGTEDGQGADRALSLLFCP